ncbi:---NA--- [Lecanosticta acicola]|uniref:---NA n=1 Tax=Lecanosticta acicola TaxID=111012 RepID=A0AAI8YTF4_9PEZI|nr:---NA--- [Lecanosticta acicola]
MSLRVSLELPLALAAALQTSADPTRNETLLEQTTRAAAKAVKALPTKFAPPTNDDELADNGRSQPRWPISFISSDQSVDSDDHLFTPHASDHDGSTLVNMETVADATEALRLELQRLDQASRVDAPSSASGTYSLRALSYQSRHLCERCTVLDKGYDVFFQAADGSAISIHVHDRMQIGELKKMIQEITGVARVNQLVWIAEQKETTEKEHSGVAPQKPNKLPPRSVNPLHFSSPLPRPKGGIPSSKRVDSPIGPPPKSPLPPPPTPGAAPFTPTSAPSFQVTIRFNSKKLTTLDVHQDTTAQDVKDLIGVMTGVNTEGHGLVSQGRDLSDNQKLSFYGICDSTTLCLVKGKAGAPDAAVPTTEPLWPISGL